MARKTYDIPEEKYIEAINHLESGGTKKRGCEILGVSNNKTMERLIEEYLESKAMDKKMRAKMRKTAITKTEVITWITDYLQGATFAELSDRYYRSAEVIKSRIDRAGALLRHNGKINPIYPPMLPEACVAESFEDGEIVWSAKYGCAVQVRSKYKNAYAIRVATPSVQENCYQAAYELGSLRHLAELGVDLTSLIRYYEKSAMAKVNKAVHEMNKRDKK